MSDNKIYYGRGTRDMFDDYMDFINYVFGFNGNDSDFKKLLPKLYKNEYEPAVSSYVAIEDGKLKAAIGAYDHDISVCGTTVKTRGIGNVAVHPYARGKGYMKKLMNMALDDMIADGIALSVLGGRRQRYNYFSYDKLGAAVSISFVSDNIRHTFGAARWHKIVFQTVSECDSNILTQICALSESQAFHALREKEKYHQILSSWGQKIYAGYDGDSFMGYAVINDCAVSEMLVTDETRISEFACSLFDHIGRGKLLVKIPVFLPQYIQALYRIGESYSFDISKSFSVLNFKVVTEAFMRLKATYTTLPDGELCLDVNGRGGHERILISVVDSNISVIDTDKVPDLTLSHIDAMNLLFASCCPERNTLPNHVQLWLPLPIYIYSSDAV